MEIILRKLIIVSLFVAIVSSTSHCGNVKCDGIPKHYRELGCTAVTENNECCPSRFNCPDTTNLASNKCYWKGKTFNIGDEIPFEETNPLCSAGCSCEKGYRDGAPAEFECAEIECAHFFNADLNQCTRISTLESCCPRHICDERETKSLGSETCIVDGRPYHLGEKIYPDSEECYKCICTLNFDNSTIVGNQACKEINCGVELRYFGDVRLGCIPMYYGTTDCCPVAWKCPTDSDAMLLSGRRLSAATDPKLQCKFGKLTLNIGDQIKTKNECQVCKCFLPPMAHCIEKPNC